MSRPSDEDPWLTWAKRLQAIASTGSHFASRSPQGQFDDERYREVASIANAMLAALGNVPIPRIEALLSDYAAGYATPKIDVRGAVIVDQKILLVQERSDRLWTMPGGYADVGLSPASNVEKEIREEANVRVRARALYGVIHKARHEYAADVRDFYKLFFLCEKLDDVVPHAGPEIHDVGYFSPDALPPLSRGRVIEKHIHTAFQFAANADRPTLFD
jgi:ADP-ribose pyrophosphatase YjhB (NUDIX family)